MIFYLRTSRNGAITVNKDADVLVEALSSSQYLGVRKCCGCAKSVFAANTRNVTHLELFSGEPLQLRSNHEEVAAWLENVPVQQLYVLAAVHVGPVACLPQDCQGSCCIRLDIYTYRLCPANRAAST